MTAHIRRTPEPRPRRDWIAVGLVGYLVALLLFIIAPIVIVILNSFSASPFSFFPPPGFSLRWYANLLSVPQFWHGAKLSLVVAAAATLLVLAVATLAALAFVRHRFFARPALQALYLAPAIVPRVAIGLAMFVFFLRLGIFGNPVSLVLAHTVLMMPLALLIIIATLSNVDRRLEEAAMDLGAPPLRTFFSVTLHQMATGMAVAALLTFILSFDEVETTIFIARHDYQTLPIEMFNYMERWQNPTIAALSTVLIAFSLGMALALTQVAARGGLIARWSGGQRQS